MMDRRSAYRRCTGSPGFTLLELLLAISIFAMVVAVMFSSFWAGITSWQKGEERIEFQQRMRAVCELLFREITATHPYFITPSQLDKHRNFVAFFGSQESLRFVSYANLHKRASGLCMIELWVSDRKGLMLGEAAALAANREDFDAVDLRSSQYALEVCPDVRSLRFRYYVLTGQNEEGEWLENWDPLEQKQFMPILIEVSVAFADPRGETVLQQLVVPIMANLQSSDASRTARRLTRGAF